ncbi:deoxyribodipyrimidine photo-lyase [Alishewanella longhuensis]
MADYGLSAGQFEALSQHLPARESASWQRIDAYLWQQKHILHYKDTRNRLIGDNYASFFFYPSGAGYLVSAQFVAANRKV